MLHALSARSEDNGGRDMWWPSLHVLNKLGVQKGEPHELGLIQVHHKQLIGGREIRFL